MLKLFDDEEGPDLDVEIKTNNDYATHYNLWRQKEELNRLKTKYGDPLIANDISEDESSSSDDEDEDGRELTAEFEKDFFKALSCLKNKDPKIYDDKTIFFKEKQPDENEGEEKKKKAKKNEPMFMKDYERKMLLEKGAKFEESDEEEEQENDARAYSPTYVEEQRKLKESLKQALNEDGNEEENWGGLFMKRQKTKEEEEKEEEDYKKWLKGNKDQLENKDEESAFKPLKEYWSNPSLDDTETFLRDYLLNKRYLDKEDANHIPTYEEIIHDSDDGFSEDEKNIDTQEEFEQKYNFRYEEPDQEFIKRYPRTMEHSVRKTDDRRKVKRQEIKERKEEEKKQKQEDLKQLKIFKRREIGEQIKKLKEITGNNDLAFEDADLDGDFDPEAHDRKMQELFNDNYYGGEEGDLKPEFSDLEEELGPWKGDNETYCEDDNFVMDCDYDPNAVPKEKDKKGKKKRNRPGKVQKGEEEELPIDENDERYEEYMDELYKLDYEDMIGDTPCRFKYRDVMPNDFGLTVEEILLAKDRELNRWCSLKKTTQFRPDHMEKYDVIAYQRKSQNEDLKKKILPSLYSEDLAENLKDLEKKQNIKPGSSENTYDEIEENFEQEDNDNELENVNENTKQNKINKQNDAIPENNGNEETLKNTTDSIGDGNKKENKSKKKNKKNINNKQNKEIVKNGGTSEALNWTIDTIESEESKENKSKKKKNKKKLNNVSAKVSVQNEVNEHVQKENTPKKRTYSESKQVITETKNNENISEGIQQNGTNSKLTRRQRKNLRKKQMPSETANTTEPKTEVKESKNRKRKRSEQGAEENESNVPKKKQKFKKDKKMKKNNSGTKDNVAISNSRLEAYGINPKKFKNKLKYKNKSSN